MSTPNSDGLKQEIDAGRMRVGNQVQLASGLPAAVSAPLATDASGNLAAGTPLVMAALTTAVAFLDFTGQSTGSADEMMHNTIVAGANVTTWTKTGFIQVNITDSGGNVTNGKHYIQFGTLS